MSDNDYNRGHDEFFDEPVPAAPAPAAPKKEKGTNKVVAVLVALLIAVVSFLGGWFGYYYSLDEEMRTLIWAKSVLEKNYYQEVDRDALYERLYAALSLDPYTKLYTPDAYEEYTEEGAGHNIGIGVSIYEEPVEGGLSLPRLFIVMENSPANRAGLKKGMYVLGYGTTEAEAAEDKTGGMDAFASFLSAQTSDFALRCGYSQDGEDAITVTLRRSSYQAAYCYYRDSETAYHIRYDIAEVDGVKGLYRSLEETPEPVTGLDDQTAYIRLDEFSGYAAEEFALCLSVMQQRGRKHLILDIRTNGGGYLDTLCEIAAYLMRNAKGTTPNVAVATYRSGRRIAYTAPVNDFGYFESDSRIYLLADENTASASECLIGAMVDYGTLGYENIYLREFTDESGKTVARTYGKGIMQSHYPNSKGAAMKLTVATINWPVSDKCIHGVGVTKADGAKAVKAPQVWGASDPMLEAVVADACN